MKFDQAVKLFTDGTVGHHLVTKHSLPLEIFPTEGTWNSFPDLSDEEQEALRTSSFGSPPIQANGTPVRCRSVEARLDNFLSLNAGAVRFSPAHRVWKSRDILAASQRWSYGSTLVVVRPYLGKGEFSKPVIVVTGPTANPFLGDHVDTDTTLGNDTGGYPSPPTLGTQPLPAIIAMTSFSTMARSRTWAETRSADDLFASFRDSGQCLTVPDSRNLHSTICVYDSGDFISTRVARQDAVLDWKIWAPVPAGSTSPTICPHLRREWLENAIIPPDPRECLPWPREAALEPISRLAEEPYLPSCMSQLVHLNPPSSPMSDSAGFMLLPRFLRLPLGILLPVGLVMDPSEMSGDKFRTLLSYFGDSNGRHSPKWAANAILDTWFAAVASSPSAFEILAFSHKYIVEAFPLDTENSFLAARLHQEWSLVSQILWDHSFAAMAGDKNKQQAAILTKYANALVAANNLQDNPDAYANGWGFISSVFRHPFLSVLRPMNQNLRENVKASITILADVDSFELPAYIELLPIHAVDKMSRKGGDIICQPLSKRSTGRDPSVEQDGDKDSESSVTDNDTAMHSPVKNPFLLHNVPSPSPKRLKTHDWFNRQAGTTITVSRRQKEDDDVHVVPPPTLFDPAANRPLFISSSTLTDPWHLPIQMTGRCSIPIKSPGERFSVALATAIRQSQQKRSSISSSTVITDSQVSFDFSFELLQSAAATKEVVVRLAFFGSFRCIISTDPAPTTIGTPTQQFHGDYHFAPGRLNPSLHPLFRRAYMGSAGASSSAITALTNWFREQCVDSNSDRLDNDFECRFDSDFYNQNIIQATLNFMVRSGQHITSLTEPLQVLTPYHFIRSIHPFAERDHNRLPETGLSAMQIGDIIGNIYFFFSLMFRDFRDSSRLGVGHSSFSQLSPLAGHLLLLMRRFRSRSLSSEWDRLPPERRLTLTEAVFLALSDLFHIYETWASPTAEIEHTFYLASAHDGTDLVLLTPTIDVQGNRLLPALKVWRDQLSIFDHKFLRADLPRSGFLLLTTPPCFRPKHPPTHLKNSPTARPLTDRSFNPSGGPRQSQDSRTPDYRNYEPRSHTQQNNIQNRRSGHPSPTGESSITGSKARVPLVVTTGGDSSKHIGDLIVELNKDRGSSARITPPKLQYINSNNRVNRPLCFRFASESGSGCVGRCRYQHLDLMDTHWVKAHVPQQFLIDLCLFLETPGIKEHYKPSSALLTLAGRR